MVKILIYSPRAIESGRGGEISSMELATGLNKYFNVGFIHSSLFYESKILSKKAIIKKLRGVRIEGRIRFATLKLMNLLFSIIYPQDFLKLYRLITKYDIIYTSYSNIKDTLMFIIFSIFHRKAKFIFGYRKPIQVKKLISLYNLKYQLSILLLSLFQKRIFHHALSKSTKKYLELFLNKNRVFHITHGIDLRNYEKSTKQGDNNKLIFSYIGYFDDIHKGVGELLKGIHLLLANNKDLDIFFEFSGMGPLESEIKALELKFPNNVKFNGYISNELVSEYYKKADVFLFSSRIEPFPRAIMEALGASLIVICTKTIGSIELLKDKPFAFFLEKLNANNIYERILYVYNIWKNNPTKFYLLKKEAKDFVFKNYSTDIEIEMFKQLIEKIY